MGQWVLATIRVLRCVLPVAAVTIMACGCSTAWADAQTLFNNLMGEYINVTPAGVFDTQTRGGITLGSVVTRSQIYRPNFVSLIPPSWKGSCGGIDLIGGSFSMINSEQLEQFLRSIAANALNYAFMLALEGVCPTCAQKLEKLKDWVNDFNKAMQNSCAWAQTLVDKTGLKDYAQSGMNDKQDTSVASGTEPDHASALMNFVSDLATDLKMGTSTSVNATWDALQKSQTASWFGSLGDTDLQEVIMSVTGSLIKAPTSGSGQSCTNTDNTKEYCYQELIPLLSVQDFVDGSDSGTVQIWRCGSDTWSCLSPTKQTATWPGLKTRIQTILFGPAPGLTGGLISKLRNPSAKYTSTEQGFIEGAPLPVYSLLKNVAQYQGSLNTMGQQLQQLISMQVARDVVLQMIDVVKKSFGAQNVQMSPMMSERLKDRTTEFQARVSYEDREFNSMLSLVQAMSEMSRIAVSNERANVSLTIDSGTESAPQ